jgi:hypothetical protein
MPRFEEGVELVLDELWQIGGGGRLYLGDEGRRVLLHQAVQRCLFRAVAIVLNPGDNRLPVRLPAGGLHARIPR